MNAARLVFDISLIEPAVLPSLRGYSAVGVAPVVLLQICVVVLAAVPLPVTVSVKVSIDVYWLFGWVGFITYEPTPLETKLDNALFINEAFNVVSVCSCIGADVETYSKGLIIPDSSLPVDWFWVTVVVLTVDVAPPGVVWPTLSVLLVSTKEPIDVPLPVVRIPGPVLATNSVRIWLTA